MTGEGVIARIAFVPARWAEEGPGFEPPRCIRLADEDTTLQLTLTWNQVPAWARSFSPGLSTSDVHPGAP